MKHDVFISVNKEESNNWACNNDGFDICHVKTSGEMNSGCVLSYEVV